MEQDGLEVFAGVSVDPDWGPVLAFGTGGVLIETLGDVALRTLPLREGDAEAMIAETRAATLLAGVRGRPPGDVPALVRCLTALADFAWAERDHVAEIDVNPIVVRERGKGCMTRSGAVSALRSVLPSATDLAILGRSISTYCTSMNPSPCSKSSAR